MPRALRSELVSHADRALASSPGAAESWRLTPPEKLHLTLVFLANVDEDLARDLPRILAASDPEGLNAPRLLVRAPGPLQVLGGGGALTVQVDCLDGALEELRESVRGSCLSLAQPTGIRAEGGAFQPHLTVARRVRGEGRDGVHPDNLQLTQDLDWTPAALTVTFSTPRPSGSFYEPAGNLPLRPRSQP